MLRRTPVIYILNMSSCRSEGKYRPHCFLLVFLNDYRWCSYVRGISRFSFVSTHGPFSTKLFSIATGLRPCSPGHDGRKAYSPPPLAQRPSAATILTPHSICSPALLSRTPYFLFAPQTPNISQILIPR